MIKKILKKGLTIFVCLLMVMEENIVYAVSINNQIVRDVDINLKETICIGENGGYLYSSLFATKNLYLERKFTTPQGHGFVAERANNLIDSFTDYNFLEFDNKVLDINAPNSPDRKIINRSTKHEIWIQDKYCKTANDTVNAAFDKELGMYKYFDRYGNPMTLEVPKDQYEEAIKKMAEKIKEGKVKGVSDPNEASNYVKSGHYTYKQVRNIAKAGNIDSLKYDATNGAIISTISIGISFTIDIVSAIMNGEDMNEALKDAALNSLKTGGVVFASYLITSQLTKAGVKTALKPTSEALVKVLGKDICESLLELYGVEYSKKNIITRATNLIQNQIIVNGVIVVAMTVPEICDLLNGRISKEQFVKNVTIAIVSLGAGTVGATAGAKVGSSIAPGAGTIAGVIGGAIIGSVVGIGAGALADMGLSKLYEGDANQMYKIIEIKLQELAEDFLLNQVEAEKVVTLLQKELKDNILKDMYASENREQFAENLMEPMFEQVVKERHNIEIPTEEKTRRYYKLLMKGVALIH